MACGANRCLNQVSTVYRGEVFSYYSGKAWTESGCVTGRKEATSLGKRKYRESLPKWLSGRAGTERATWAGDCEEARECGALLL